MRNIYSSHLLSNILLQFHSATDSQTEDILKAFNRLTNLNLTLEDVSNLNTGLTFLPPRRTLNLSERFFISEEIAKVCKEATKHTPKNQKRLKVILAACLFPCSSTIKKLLNCSYDFVKLWTFRFLEGGLSYLQDAQRSGRPLELTDDDYHVIFNLLMYNPCYIANFLTNVDEGFKHQLLGMSSWTTNVLARIVQKSKSTIDRFLKRHNLSLAPSLNCTYCFSTDPYFEEKLTKVSYAYNLPAGARAADGKEIAVICADEMPGIPIREFIYCLNSGKQVKNGSEYIRHGVATIFAALEPKTGKVICDFPKDKCKSTVEDFLSCVVSSSDYIDKHVILIMDNIRTHKNFSKEWHDKYDSRVEIYFTPTHCSWANLVETFFSIVKRSLLKNRSWTSVQEFIKNAEAFCAEYNSRCKPYKWSLKDLQVFFNQRRDTIDSIQSVTETPVYIDFGLMNHEVSYQNTLFKAKENREKAEITSKGGVVFFDYLKKAENSDCAYSRLERIPPVLFDVYSPDVDALLKDLDFYLAELKQSKQQIKDLEIQISQDPQSKSTSDLIQNLKQVRSAFNKTVKTCLKMAKDACASVAKDQEVIASVQRLLRRIKLFEKSVIKSPYEDNQDASIWVKQTWSLLNDP